MGQLPKSFCPIFSKTGSCLHLLIQEHRLWGHRWVYPNSTTHEPRDLGRVASSLYFFI